MEVKLKLKIKDVELELTQDEAEELYGVLKQLVGDKETEVKIVERFRDYWPYWPYSTSPKITYPEITYEKSEPDKWEYEPITVYSSDTIELKAMSIGVS